MIRKQLSEEELFFMECFYNPKCMIETLYPRGALQTWIEGEPCITVRTFQIPMLAYDVCIEDDDNLSAQENFETRIKVGTIYIILGRKLGKCEYEENECLLANGSIIKFKDLLNKEEEVLSLDVDNLKIVKSKANFFDNGKKYCYKLTTNSGKETIKTHNHPFYTPNGWLELKDLKIGDFIATPREYNIEGIIDIDENIAKLLGYLIGDGGCTTANTCFTNINEEIIKEYKQLADYFDCFISQRNKNKVRSSDGKLNKSKIRELVLKYEINKKAKEKTIHKEIFLWKKEKIALLLNRLFACDAHNRIEDRVIEITLASKKLIYQIQHLLLRFGIHSRIHYKIAKCNNKLFSAWRLDIALDYDKFMNIIGIKTKDNGVRRNKTYSTGDRIPNIFFKNILKLIPNKVRQEFRKMKLYNSSREKWERLNNKCNLIEIDKIANSDVMWDQITNIEFFGEKNTVGVSVEKYHNYISDDIISHNTYVALTGNMLLKFLCYSNKEMTFSSYDEKHVDKVLDKVRNFFFGHPFFKQYKKSIKGSPEYTITTHNGNILYGINETTRGKDPGCVDSQTEILTDSGWKFFKDLDYNNKVLSLNNEGIGYYSNIKKIISSEYIGFLKRFKSSTSEFLFTPSHNIGVIEHDVFKLKQLDKDKFFKQIYMKPNFKWIGVSPKKINFLGISNSNKIEFSIKTELWLKFVAWYLGEGSLQNNLDSHYRIVISQKKNCKELESLLYSMNLKYNKKLNNVGSCYNYTISNKLIWQHLLDNFGKVKEKRIPNYLKNYSSKFLNIFLNEYLLGDGTIRLREGSKLPYRGVCTSLKNLADDLHEVALKAGYKSNMLLAKNHVTKYGVSDIYWIILGNDKTTVFQRDKIEDVGYNGKVYCVETEPYHTILIRRNGRVIWTGNSNWIGNHTDINFSDEIQASTEVSQSKKVDAIGELGCIEILAGVPLVTKVSPLGRILKDRDKQKSILRFPQFCSPFWTDKIAKDREKEYGGKNTLGWRVNVEAELVTGASGAFDLERIRRNYNTEKIIKSFEITKENFSEYKHILILDRYKNSDRTFVFADIGDTAATEIGIIFRINKKYHLVYNITSYRLADNELSEMLAWIFKKVDGNFIGVDATGAGKPIYRQLCDLLETKKDKKVICDKCNKEYLKINIAEDKCPVCKSNVRDLGKKVIWIAFNENIVADYEKDDEGKAVLDEKCKPIFIEENTLIFAVQRLRILFYSELFVIPDNFVKFDEQFSAYFQVTNNNRVSFGSSADDHLLQSMQVFSIMEWQTENLPNINPKREIKKSGLGSFNF